MSKDRLTVTVDPQLVEAGNAAVAEGRAGSLSAWVNLALHERAAKDRRLRALAEAGAAYESAFGVVQAAEPVRPAARSSPRPTPTPANLWRARPLAPSRSSAPERSPPLSDEPTGPAAVARRPP